MIGAALMLVVAALATVSLLVGAYSIALPDLGAALFGVGDPKDEFILRQLRLPRVTMALLAGIAFALSGALFQSLLGNPLASPDIIGITAGASASAAAALLIFGASGLVVSGAALGGGLAAAALIYLTAWRSGLTGYRFVLIGIALAFLLKAVLGYLLTRADVRDAQAALVWLVGSLGTVSWEEIGLAALGLAILIPMVAFVAPALSILRLGDDTAAGLGVRVQATRVLILAVAVALASLATAAVGPIAFVAFVSAPIARSLVGSGRPALVPSALVGALLVLASDFAAQHLLPGGLQVPVGIITGAVGAPYLLFLLARSNRRRGEL